MSNAKSKYHRTVKGVSIDVYDVLTAFGVTNPAVQHAVKKLLMPGQRGAKNTLQDLAEAKVSVERAIQIEGEALGQDAGPKAKGQEWPEVAIASVPRVDGRAQA